MALRENKNILFVTGTRADYGKIYPLAKILAENGFNISFFITGMHMLKRYGETRNEVLKFQNATFYEYINQRIDDPHDAILIKTIRGFSDLVHENTPDIVVVHGDRVEALAVSLVCAMNYIPIAHIEGGEVSGTIDEIYRHCNSKLCNFHFVSSDVAKKRLVSLGENPESIFIIGSPEMDLHTANSGPSMQEVRDRYDIGFKEYGIALFHPVTSEQSSIGSQAKALFDSLSASGRKFVVILPNNDPGSQDIFDVIRNLDEDKFKVIPSLRFTYFSTLMKNCACIVGNSSMGVREAPFLGIPSLDIGTRQNLRAVSSSVCHASAEQSQEIKSFIEREWMKRYEPHMGYGDGKSSTRFLTILQDKKFWQMTLQKTFYE